MQVKTSNYFNQLYPTLDIAIRQAIAKFVEHLEQDGLTGLQGRNKSSAIANPHTKKERQDANFAQKHCLWHYHLGIPCYVGEFGDMTSELILHYCHYDDVIVLIDIASHPPFELPSLDKIKRDAAQ